jgi:hypothetical protein
VKNLDDVFNDGVVKSDYNIFTVARSLGFCRGRAYFNSLGETERGILRGSDFDPYYKDTDKSILQAHDYLRSQLFTEAI